MVNGLLTARPIREQKVNEQAKPLRTRLNTQVLLGMRDPANPPHTRARPAHCTPSSAVVTFLAVTPTARSPSQQTPVTVTLMVGRNGLGWRVPRGNRALGRPPPAGTDGGGGPPARREP